MLFDSDETEKYFNEQSKHYNISHVNTSKKKIFTKEDIDEIMRFFKDSIPDFDYTNLP